MLDGGPCFQHGGRATAVETVIKPQDWGKAVSVAFLWLVIGTQKGAAEAAGIGERTMNRWVISPWWPDACAEAKQRWLSHLTLESMRTLIRKVSEGDADKAWDVLQQFDDDFRPRPKEVRVLGVLAFVEQLADETVRHIMGMPEAERRGELVKLAQESGVELAGR
jgi:hypothetical protein